MMVPRVTDLHRTNHQIVAPVVRARTRAIGSVARLRRARHGVTVERVVTDNGSSYTSSIHAIALPGLGVRTCAPAPTAPDRRQSERFIPVVINGWADGAVYRDTTGRAGALPGWLWY
jgi:hypothetical protein